MSTSTLRAIEGGRPAALDRVVATAKKMEEHEEIDRWQFADDVAEAVDSLSEHQNGFGAAAQDPKANTGLYRAIDEVNDRIAKAGVVTVGRQSIVGAYTTAKVWPPEERVQGANYWAHFELRSRAYTNRRQVLERLVRRHKGTVSTPQVRLWKSDSNPVDLTPRDERLEKRLRTGLRAWASPQAFTNLHEDDRTAAVRILNKLVNEIVAGEFK